MTARQRRDPARRRPDARRGRNRAWWPFGSKAKAKRCHTTRECGDPQYCCDREKEVCIHRDRLDAPKRCARSDFYRDPPKSAQDPDALTLIEGQPGSRGFNAEVRRRLRARQIQAAMTCEPDGRQDQAHQVLLRHLIHEDSTIRRLLVAWTPGTGKTRAMIRVLENLYEDPAPKLILFPTQALVDNFYEEFIRVDNRYMRKWRSRNPDVENPYAAAVKEEGLTQAEWEALNKERDRFRERIRSFMELWPSQVFDNAYNGLKAPLRAFTMEQAGAADFTAQNRVLNWSSGKGTPRSETCAIKGRQGGLFSNAGTRRCLFDRTVVLVDEAHNLFFPGVSAGNGNLGRLRERIYDAHEAVMLFFTATPVLTGSKGTEEAREVLRFVKGHEGQDAVSDEGFVSWYMERPREVFATTQPLRLTDIVAQNAAPNLYRVHINRSGPVGSKVPWAWRHYVHVRYGEPEPPAWRRPRTDGDGDSEDDDGDGAAAHPVVYDPVTRKHRLAGKKPAAAKTTAVVAPKPPGKKPRPAVSKTKAPAGKTKKKKPSVAPAVSYDYDEYVFAGKPKTTTATTTKKKKALKTTAKKTSSKKSVSKDASHGSFRGRLRSQPGEEGDRCIAANRCDALWSIHEHLWFDPRETPETEAILTARLTPENAVDLAPKLAAIAESVRNEELKTLILIHEAYGPLVLWHLLREHGVPAILLRRPGRSDPKTPVKGFPPPATAFDNWQQLLAFNANNNRSGQLYRVAVAAVEEFGEGVSFIGVRRVVIASLSGVDEQPRWPLVQQWIARALRMCSHEKLPASLRTLSVDLFVACSDHPRYHRTLDEQRLDFLREEIGGVNAGMELLRRVAIDDGMYEPAKGWFSWLRWK